jgi:hypothetical protein
VNSVHAQVRDYTFAEGGIASLNSRYLSSRVSIYFIISLENTRKDVRVAFRQPSRLKKCPAKVILKKMKAYMSSRR